MVWHRAREVHVCSPDTWVNRKDSSGFLGTDEGYFHKPYSLCTPRTAASFYSQEFSVTGVALAKPKHACSEDSILQNAPTSLFEVV